MSKYKPLYRYTLKNAQEFDEVDQWREGHRENCKCANDITEAINSNYHDNRLDNCVQPIIEKYGFDRVNWVIANTIREGIEDGRYSVENKKWAKSFDVLSDDQNNWHFCVTAHPGLVDLFANQLRDAWNKLGLLDGKDTVDEKEYEQQLLILKPTVLSDDYRHPDYQLFYATAGFGCHYNSLGAKIFGFFLKDGEETSFRRNDFYGVANEESLPEWAREKLADIRMSQSDNGESDAMTMEVT